MTFYETIILSEGKRAQRPRLSWHGKFSEPKTADQKFFLVSGMGFGQQSVKKWPHSIARLKA